MLDRLYDTIKSSGIKVDGVSLTGESVVVRHKCKATQEQIALAESLAHGTGEQKQIDLGLGEAETLRQLKSLNLPVKSIKIEEARIKFEWETAETKQDKDAIDAVVANFDFSKEADDKWREERRKKESPTNVVVNTQVELLLEMLELSHKNRSATWEQIKRAAEESLANKVK